MEERQRVKKTVTVCNLLLCPHFQLLAALVLEKLTVTISTLQIHQPCLIPPHKLQVKDTHTFPSGSCGGSSLLLSRLICLGDSSFQPSITCKMRKKSSGSFMSLCAGFVGICGSFFCKFVEVCVYLWTFLKNL